MLHGRGKYHKIIIIGSEIKIDRCNLSLSFYQLKLGTGSSFQTNLNQAFDFKYHPVQLTSDKSR